jgi:hypothetical protein
MNNVIRESIANNTAKDEIDTTQNLNEVNVFLQKIDVELNKLIPYIKKAVESNGVVVVLQMWESVKSLSLLPFHLHLRWANVVDGLPLITTFGYIPALQQDWAFIQTPLYKVSEVLESRKQARIKRVKSTTSHKDDLKIPDWEQGCFNHLEKITDHTLAGNSFLCIDSVNSSNICKRGGRPVLGRLANRNGFRPRILIAGKGGISEDSAQSFTEVDLLIVNAQGLRGKSLLRSTSNALRARGSDRPTLIIATSPSDLIMLGLNQLIKNYSLFTIGNVPDINKVSVTPVGLDRPFAERDFSFAVEELRGKGKVDDYLLDLAKNAWWATRQSVASDGIEPEFQHFINTFERVREQTPDAAKLLRPGLDLILNTSQDKSLSKSRRDAVISSVLNTSGNFRTAIIARGNGIAKLKDSLSNRLEIKPYELSELDIRIHSQLHRNFRNSNDLAIAAGYYGHLTIDAIFASKATQVELVLDPLEARAAWQWVKKLIEFFKEIPFEAPIIPLKKLMDGIEEGIPVNLRSFVTDVNLYECFLDTPVSYSQGNATEKNFKPASESDLIINFVDGSFIEVGKNSRFDVLTNVGQKLKTIPAHKLQFGDEIILLEENSRALFSDKLFETLDNGILKESASARSLWLTIIKSIKASRKPNLRHVTQRMNELGQPVEYNTVRSWMNYTNESDATIPYQKNRFLAFAQALEITIPEPILIQKFNNIKRWRVGHRRAGRNLSKIIRAAYTNRLDAASKERLKREWGLDVLQLVQGAYTATVDEIILP